MLAKKLQLIDENSSPLFRIMSIYTANGAHRGFGNNVCAFHIGKGIILSVAHSLKTVESIPPVITEHYFQHELLAKVDAADRTLFEGIYANIAGMQRLSKPLNQPDAQVAIQKLNTAKVDRRYATLYAHNCCKPFLILSFRTDAFCGDAALNVHFAASDHFHEPGIKRFTFLLELEVIETFDSEDLAIYKLRNPHPDVLGKMPILPVDFKIYDTGSPNFYCLQAAPYDNLGRIVNEVSIDGLMDNFVREGNIIAPFILEGLRYLVKGYFRFGSSGAPYIVYDNELGQFRANAVQSQASHIQLSINNKREGNLQYVNGVAAPIALIQHRLEELLNEASGENA